MAQCGSSSHLRMGSPVLLLLLLGSRMVCHCARPPARVVRADPGCWRWALVVLGRIGDAARAAQVLSHTSESYRSMTVNEARGMNVTSGGRSTELPCPALVLTIRTNQCVTTTPWMHAMLAMRA